MNTIILHGAGERGKERVMSFVLSAVKIIAETATSAAGLVLNKISALCSTIVSGIAYIRWLFEEGSRLQLLESCQGEALTGDSELTLLAIQMSIIILHSAEKRGKERVMSFVSSALKLVAETTAAATGAVLATANSVGTAIAGGTASLGTMAGSAATTAATTLGVAAGTAAAVAGTTPTALTVSVMRQGANLLRDHCWEE